MFGLRERSHEDGTGPEPDSDHGLGSHLGELRQRGEDLLSAGDEAIDRGFSRQSQKFNTNVRQAPGQ